MASSNEMVTKLPLALRQSLEKGECVLFIGAGIGYHYKRSDGTAVPDAKQLATDLIAHFKLNVDTDAIAELEDRRSIIGVASETDDLPVGEVRKLWASYALKEKDVEIARAEELYRADFMETCRRIVKTESLG